VNARLPAAGLEAVLLDIEGTTTPITFVTEVLFPYARTHLREYIERHADAAEYEQLFKQLKEEHASDASAQPPPPPWIDNPRAARLGSVTSYVEWLMDRDRKSTPLKELQGRIWNEGYSRGELQAKLFSDVPSALERWSSDGIRIGIFSSGSVLAQQLLFRHTPAGDLTRFLTWYFDTTSGPKMDPNSYRRIAKTMAVTASAIVFISDITRELDAARDAGMSTRLAIRPGNVQQPGGHGHPEISTFADLI
jgi:enolase-phosphatase E1